MKILKYLGGPAIIAVLAVLCQIVDQLIGGSFPIGTTFGWVAFQAWASYFIAGCTPRGGLKALLGYVVGIVASIAIIAFAGVLGGLGFWAVPLSLLILVIPTIATEKVELLNLTPIVFVAAGAYFAIMNYVPDATYATAALVEMVFCVIGLILGYLTILIRGAYDKKFNSAE